VYVAGVLMQERPRLDGAAEAEQRIRIGIDAVTSLDECGTAARRVHALDDARAVILELDPGECECGGLQVRRQDVRYAVGRAADLDAICDRRELIFGWRRSGRRRNGCAPRDQQGEGNDAAGPGVHERAPCRPSDAEPDVCYGLPGQGRFPLPYAPGAAPGAEGRR